MYTYSSDFELFLNTADPELAKRYIDRFPFSGLTCNPQMISDLKRPDFINVLKELRDAAGDRKLFIQAPSNDYNGILEDVDMILSVIGHKPAYVKIAACADGIQAIMDLAAKGVNVCATQVMSTLQGISALHAGAKYICVFYAMMDMGGRDNDGFYGGTDPKTVYHALNTFIDKFHCPGKIMACAPRTADEISYMISSGVGSITLDPNDFDACFANRNFQAVHQDVRASWESVYGDTTIRQML